MESNKEVTNKTNHNMFDLEVFSSSDEDVSVNGEDKGLSILADAAAYVDYDTNDCCWDDEAFLNEAVEMCDLASSPKKLVSQEPVCHDAASLFAKSNSFGEAIASTSVEDKPEFPSPEKFAQMIYRNEGGANWTESEFQSNANASENRTTYEDRKYKTFDNFLSILEGRAWWRALS